MVRRWDVLEVYDRANAGRAENAQLRSDILKRVADHNGPRNDRQETCAVRRRIQRQSANHRLSFLKECTVLASA